VKIHTKALLIFAMAMGLLFTVVFLLSTRITLGAYRRMEVDAMRARALQFSLALKERMRAVTSVVGDWSPWNELYEFAQTRDPKFLRINLRQDVLENLGMGFFLIADADGHVIGEMTAKETAFPPLEALLKRSGFLASQPPAEMKSGMVLLDGHICFLSAAPILTSLREGPSVGTIVGGAFLDVNELYQFEAMTDITVHCYPFAGSNYGADSQGIGEELLASYEPVVRIENEETVAVYLLERNILGEPGFVSKIESQRVFWKAGKRTIDVFMVAFTLAGGVLFLIVFFGLDRAVLSPVRRLQKRVEAADVRGGLPLDLGVKGGDEISQLAKGIEILARSLAAAQKEYRSVVETQSDLICRYVPEGRITFMNPAFRRFFNFPLEGFPDCRMCDILPQSLVGDPLEIRRKLESVGGIMEVEQEVLDQDGNKRWFECTAHWVLDAANRLVEIQEILRDVTENRLAKIRLEESEAGYRMLFENDWDGIAIVNREGVIGDVNPSLCALLRFKPEDVMGRRFVDVIPFSNLPEEVLLEAATGSGKTRQLRSVEMLRVDGKKVFVDVVTASYVSSGRQLVQWNFRDVTARKKADAQLRSLSARLLKSQDQERRRIARELHDSTGQNLSALQMNLSLLEASLQDASPSTLEVMEECQQMLDQCCTEIRTMSYLLHPPLLDEMGLVFAIKWFVDGFARRTGLWVSTELDEKIPRLPIDVEIALYRVLQESFNNIHRHSGGSHTWVRFYRKGELLVLEIEDDGVGIDPEQLTAFNESIPVLGVGLLGMRERITQLGGRLVIQSNSTGTLICVMLPQGPHEKCLISES